MHRFRSFRRPRQPPEPPTPIKLLFGLYQCLHHLAFATGNGNTVSKPRRPRRLPFSHKVDELDRLITPAMPHIDSGFHKKCHEINIKWQEAHIKNIINHYDYCKNELMGNIASWGLPTSDWNQYLSKARQWANKHFRQKFQALIFKEVEKLVLSQASDARPPTKKPSNRVHTPLVAPTPSTPSRKRGRHQSGESSPTSLQTPKKSKSIVKSGVKASLAEPIPSTPSGRRGRCLSAGSSEVKASPAAPGLSTPSRKRGRRMSAGSSPNDKQTPKKNKASFSPIKSSNINETKPLPTAQRGVIKYPRLPPRTLGEKINDFWNIPQFTKDIVVLGTSNLARITHIGRMDAQVISYPGLKLQSLLQLIQQFQYRPGSKDGVRKPHKPKHIILAAGINDRGLAKSTNSVNLKKIVQAAKEKFKDSKISLYMNRYSPELNPKEREALKDLNSEIEKQCEAQGLNLIAPVPTKSFEVNPNDHIHWSEKCANLTITHMIDTAVKSNLHNINNNSPSKHLN